MMKSKNKQERNEIDYKHKFVQSTHTVARSKNRFASLILIL